MLVPLVLPRKGVWPVRVVRECANVLRLEECAERQFLFFGSLRSFRIVAVALNRVVAIADTEVEVLSDFDHLEALYRRECERVGGALVFAVRSVVGRRATVGAATETSQRVALHCRRAFVCGVVRAGAMRASCSH